MLPEARSSRAAMLLFSLWHQSQTKSTNQLLGSLNLWENERTSSDWEREERSEERESPDRVSILSRRNMINVMAHRCHHQDRRVPIYNSPLPHRCSTSRSGQTRGLDSDLPFLVYEALRFVSQNNHYFWNQETPICCSPLIGQPNGVGSLFTHHMSRSSHREHILPGVPKTLRPNRLETEGGRSAKKEKRKCDPCLSCSPSEDQILACPFHRNGGWCDGWHICAKI